MLERGRANTLTCPLYASGAVVQSASGTVSIYDQAGSAVHTASLTGLPGTATTTYTPPTTLPREAGWRVEWSVVVRGVDRVFYNDAILARVALFPVITDLDLYRRASILDPNGTAPVHSETTFQDKIDEAWAQIQTRLAQDGRRAHLIMSPSALRQVHLELAFKMIWDDFKHRLNEAYRQMAIDAEEAYEREWKRLSFVYDENDDALSTGARQRARPVVMLCGVD